MTCATSSTAWLPTLARNASGSERWLIDTLMPRLPLCSTMATPRSRRSCGYGTGHKLTPLDEVDDAVAVRAKDGQVAGRLAQRLLAGGAFGRARLGEARRVENGSAGAELGKLTDDLDAGGGVDRDERSVRRRGEVEHRRVRGVPADLGPGGMNGVDRPVEAGRLALGKSVRRERAADERDAPRPQQPADVLLGGGHPRRTARPIRSRWISDVPSQIRSTRASRQ